MSLYLDIETGRDGRMTVIGFYHETSGMVQLTGNEISRTALVELLPDRCPLFTYNGHCFDLRVIRDQLGVDLRQEFESYDLRWICQRHGLTGGLKAVERTLGISRDLSNVNGMDAMRLWYEYEQGSHSALAVLLKYNREDVMNLVELRHHLERRNLFCLH